MISTLKYINIHTSILPPPLFLYFVPLPFPFNSVSIIHPVPSCQLGPAAVDINKNGLLPNNVPYIPLPDTEEEIERRTEDASKHPCNKNGM